MHFRNIDLLKGVLIILVIAGHTLQGEISENILRYIIYTFHMPLFIGIGGYLLNYVKIESLSVRALLHKYFYRLILPWAIAVIIYLILFKYDLLIKHQFSLLFYAFLTPFYHLWFVEAFLSWIFVAWLARKMNIIVGRLLIISLLVSVSALIIQQYPNIYSYHPYLNGTLKVVMYTFRPYYFVFFVFGIYLKTHPQKLNTNLNIVLILVSFTGNVILFFHPTFIATVFLYLLFNLSALALLIKLSSKNLLPRNRKLEWMGVNSLGIYLWHLIPLFIAKRLVNPHKLTLFYVASFGAEIIFLILLSQISKITFVNKYFLGMVDSSKPANGPKQAIIRNIAENDRRSFNSRVGRS